MTWYDKNPAAASEELRKNSLRLCFDLFFVSSVLFVFNYCFGVSGFIVRIKESEF